MEKIKLLIVEDDEISSFYLATVTKSICREVLFAVTGLEAVDVLRKNSDIDLILMDLSLPVMSGYEATQKIREFNTDVVIVAQTALDAVDDNKKSLEAGCDAYITKPIKSSSLLTLISSYFKTDKN